MTARAGISLLDLVASGPISTPAPMPSDVTAFLDRLAIVDHSSMTSAAQFSHFGTVQGEDIGLPRMTGSGEAAEAPDLKRGVYFRLLMPRAAPRAGETVEPAPGGFVLDLIFDPIGIERDELTPARFAPAAGAAPAHLEPAVEVRRPSDPPRKTRIYARGAFRVSALPGESVEVRFVDFPDPFDAELSAGPVVDAWFEPPHFFMGDLGFSVGEITLDLSRTVTPPQIMARGQGPQWQGVAIEEATVFLPRQIPKLGVVNLGVRDLLVGRPFGLQGEVFAELGRDPSMSVGPAVGPVAIFAGTAELVLAPHPADATGRLFSVTLPRSGPALVHAGLSAPPPNLAPRWHLPRGQQQGGNVTSEFVATPGDLMKLEITRTDTVDGEERQVKFDTRSFLFQAGAAAAAELRIDLTYPRAVANVASISGSAGELNGVELLGPDIEGLKWESILGNVVVSGRRFRIEGLRPKADPLGVTFMVLRAPDGRTRRVIVHLLAEGGLVIGAEGGVTDAANVTLAARAVKAEHELGKFHAKGQVTRTTGGTTIAADGSASVPGGVLAEVTLQRAPGDPEDDEDGGGGGSPPPGEAVIERVQILVAFGKPERGQPLETADPKWGDTKVKSVGGGLAAGRSGPIAAPDAGLVASLGAWVAQRLSEHPGPAETPDPPEVLIVARCDDIQPGETSRLRNEALAQDRAAAVAAIVQAAIADNPWVQAGTDVLSVHGEQDPTLDLADNVMRAALLETDRDIVAQDKPNQRPGAVDEINSLAISGQQRGWLMPRLYEFDQFGPETRNFAPRPRYRRIDILVRARRPDAPETAASTPENELGQDPGLGRRMIWVPGKDVPESTEPKLTEPSYPMLVQVALAWDSPTVVEARDLVPTKAEVAVTWVNRGVAVPGQPTPVPLESCKDDPSIAEFLKFTARFAHDDRTGETVYTIGLDSIGDPRGLYCLRNNPLAAVAALAPALLPLLSEAGVDQDGARIAAIVALAGLGIVAAEDGRLVIEGVEAELRSRGFLQLEELRLRLGVDYSVEIGWNLPPLLTGRKVRIRYRNAGVLVDLDTLLSDPGAVDLDTVRLVFDEASVEVQDPGTWQVSNPTLGRLLRVNAARLGTGSAWIELDLGLAVDLGIVTISEATVRATLGEGGFDADLRGLEVLLDVPGTLRGKGKLAIAPDGSLFSAIELQIIPAGISAAASLKIVDGFVSLFVETRFATPLPVGGTGLGVFGFNGHLVVNGARALPAGDPVTRELAWYARPPEDRYQPQLGGWAVGLGAVVGTLPDQGFAFNAKGMLAVAVPDLSVVFAVEADFLKKPGPATATGEPPPTADGQEFRVIGLVAVDSDAVTLGLRGMYRYGRLLQVKVPVDGYFPTGGDEAWFLRVGSDGFVGSPPGTGARPGEPVSVSVLPDTLGAEATAFFMIEEKGIVALGRHEGIDLPGFAIGIGLTFDIDWGNGLIGLEALAEIVAGIGFTPLTVAAGVFVKGEVFFLLLSAGFEGELFFRYVERPGADLMQISGQLCAKVGFWRWKKTKCGTIQIGDETFSAPAPSPLAGVDLIGRSDRVIGQAASDGLGPTVWPDAIPVIHFSHATRVALAGSAFDPGSPGGPTWVGSPDLRYAYRLTGVEIRPVGGAALAGPLPSAWTFPAHRRTFPAADDAPAGDERRDLHLLSVMPFRWARNLIDGGAGLAADPAAALENVCQPLPEPLPVCLLGARAVRRGPELATIVPQAPSTGPFPSSLRLSIRERLGGGSLARAALELAERGYELRFGRVVPFSLAGESGLYEAAHVAETGRHVVTLPMDCRVAANVVEPELLLALCNREPLAGQPGQLCHDFEDFSSDFVFQTLEHGGLDYRAIQGPTTGFLKVRTAGGQRTIRYMHQGMEILLPEGARAVSATIFQMRATDDVDPPVKLTMQAFDAGGQSLGAVNDRRDVFDRNRTMRIEDHSGRGIFRVVLRGGNRRAHLVQFCFSAHLDPRLAELIEEAEQRGTGPRVRGRRKDGAEVEWVGEVVPQPIGVATPPCTLMRYRPRQPEEWTGLRIGPWRAGRVGLVRLCAVTAEARRRRDEAEEDRQDFIDDWNTPPTPPRALLQPGTEYEVRVLWQAATWMRQGENGAPSQTETEPPDEPSFAAGPPDSFRFRTAAEPTALPTEPPIDDLDESAFDPRQARRYVLALSPDQAAPPHFTDDPVRVSYAVRYLGDLLGRYGRDLRVEARRTDPAPASRPQGTPPPSAEAPLGSQPVALPSELLESLDARILISTAASDCLTEWTSEGTGEELDFELEPNAAYDLLVTAPRSAGTETLDVVLRRAHFRTSYHASPRALLDAFGFRVGLPGASLPIEMPIPAPLPAAPLPGDEAFDAAMATLGLDPLPLATRPRVALLVAGGAAPMLAGVLIDGPEPILRPGRLGLARASVVLTDGAALPLTLVRSTGAGTRLLLSLAGPVAVTTDGSAHMELALQGAREGEVAGARFITSGGLASAAGGLA